MTQKARRIIIVFLIILAGVAGTSVILWDHGVIQTWFLAKVENEAIEFYHHKIEGHIPFEIEEAHVERKWADLLLGRISKLELVLRKDDVRVRLTGPLTFPAVNWTTLKRLYRRLSGQSIERYAKEMRLDYFPNVRFESVSAPNSHEIPPPLSMHLWAGISSELDELHEVGFEATSSEADGKWKWPLAGIELQKPVLSADWIRVKDQLSPAKCDFKADALSYAGKNNVNLVQPQLSFSAPLSLQPFSLGKLLELNWSAKSGEALFGDRYFSAASEALTGEAQIETSDSGDSGKNLGLSLHSMTAAIGKTAGQKLHLHATMESGPAKNQALVSAQLDPIDLKEALPALIQSTANAGAPFTALSGFPDLKFHEGKLSLSANAHLPLNPRTHQIDTEALSSPKTLEDLVEQAEIHLNNASLVWPSHQLAVKKLNLRLPYRAGHGAEGELSISRFGFRKLRGSLKPTWISYVEREEGEDKHSKQSYLRIGRRGENIPLELDGLLLRIESISGTAQLLPLQYDVDTAISLEPVELEKITAPLCLTHPGSRVVPATVRADFSKVDLYTGSAEISGTVRADLFGGSIQVNQIGVFEFNTEVPEIDFNLDMTGIDLHEIGTWDNFGEMDGTLSGYAHNVVFQSALPTQYDLEIKLQPKHHSDVVFSPDAMKNFARLFAEDGIDHIPGFAQWLAFGLPSRLLGGYDIDYAGVHVHSEDGYIKLETLDPLPTVESGLMNPEVSGISGSSQKHFILFGKRFKIPIRSSRYPLILDATAMGNFVHRKWAALESLAKSRASGAKKKEDLKNEEAKSESFDSSEDAVDESLPADCVPTDLLHL